MHLSNRQLFLNNLAQTSDAPLLMEVDRAEGCWLYGPDNKKYLDLISGISVSSLGHGNPEIISAIHDQASRHMHVMVYGEVVQQPQIDLANALSAVLPEELNNFYFVNSGAEAADGAMKMAKRYTGRHHFAAHTDAYHGSSQGPLSLMNNSYFSDAYKPLLPDIHFIEQNDFVSVQTLPADRLAAIVIELIQGEKGAIPCDVDYVKSLRRFCTENEILLIVDEIQSGMGRTGEMFAFQHYGIVPDILLLGKALGGGMPIGAFIAPKHIMHTLSVNPVLGHITTFGGHPVTCAAAAKAVEITQKGLQSFSVKAKEAMFRQLLVHPRIKKVTGCGLLLAVHLDDENLCKQLIQFCLERGVFTDWFLFAPGAFRIAPPLIISEEEIRYACSVILEALTAL